MNCKDSVKSISKFLNDELDTDQLRGFISHVDTCSECKEELTIEFLIREGLNSLEEGKAFDLNRELNNNIGRANNRLKYRDNLLWVYYAISGMNVVAFFVLFILLVFA